jgi:hypothetical protein
MPGSEHQFIPLVTKNGLVIIEKRRHMELLISLVILFALDLAALRWSRGKIKLFSGKQNRTVA